MWRTLYRLLVVILLSTGAVYAEETTPGTTTPTSADSTTTASPTTASPTVTPGSPFKFSQTGEPGGVIVQLFQWRFDDIAKECEEFLGPKGFAGVEVSPVTEHISTPKHQWDERYQPLSYKIASRSGNEAAFTDMVKRCNKAGVKIYVDVILNHMTGSYSNDDVGSGGTHADTLKYSYPGVPYNKDDFNLPPCKIQPHDWGNAEKVRNCELLGLHDLNQRKPCVRSKIRNFLNKLVSIGVAGFRVDSAKHMWPEDLHAIFDNVRYLDFEQGFACESKPYFYMHFAGEPSNGNVEATDYYSLGPVTDFRYTYELCRAFRKDHDNPLKWYSNFGTSWGLLNENRSLVFIDDHNTQRGDGFKATNILSYHQPTEYKMAVAFMLAYKFGQPRLMSSFTFDPTRADGKRQGPPSNADGSIQNVKFSGDICTNGYQCEHRWRQIYNMVKFRNVVGGADVTDWWDNGGYNAAFGRDDKGFIVFNAQWDKPLKASIQTRMAPGTYCDLISGKKEDGKCTGESITVDGNKKIEVELPNKTGERMIAFTIEDKL